MRLVRVGVAPRIFLSERNLLALLAKLREPDSSRTIYGCGVYVTAEADDVHYADRVPPGPCTEVTEAGIDELRGTVRP